MLPSPQHCLALLVFFLGNLGAYGQAISPDHHWELKLTHKPGPTDIISIVRRDSGEEQVLIDQEWNGYGGPEEKDLRNAQWNRKSQGLLLSTRGRRSWGYLVFVLKKGNWIQPSFMESDPDLVDKAMSKITPSWRNSLGDPRFYYEFFKNWINDTTFETERTDGENTIVIKRFQIVPGKKEPCLKLIAARGESQAEKSQKAYDPKADYRYVHVQVLDPRGKPAADRLAQLLTTTNPAPSATKHDWRYGDVFAPFPWSCQTDRLGKFTAFLNITQGEKYWDSGPGSFVYLVENSADDAGGISAPFTHPSDLPTPQPELAHRDLAHALRSRGLNLRIQTVPGFTIHGKVIDLDAPQTPIADAIVKAYVPELFPGQDALAFARKIRVDAQGNFTLVHCFPRRNHLRVDFDENSPHDGIYQWMKTESDGKPSDAASEGVLSASPTGDVQLTIYLQRLQH